MQWETFHIDYSAEVDAYINRYTDDVITRDGVMWYVSRSDGLCMKKSEHYKVPNAVIELLKIGSVLKFGACELRLGLHTYPDIQDGMFNTPGITFENMCGICGDESYDSSGYVWTSDEGTVCEDCLDETSNNYVRVDALEYNATDYVLFAKDNIQGRYYVNCNIASAKYGNVLCMRNQSYQSPWILNFCRSVIYTNIEHFIRAVHTFFCDYVHNNNHKPLDEWDEFLNSPVDNKLIPRDAIIYGFSENMTYSDVVVNINYIREFSDELVQRCIELTKDKKNKKRILGGQAYQRISKMKPDQLTEYIQSTLVRRAEHRMFDSDMLTFVNNRIRDIFDGKKMYDMYIRYIHVRT